jgi:hypothetical protein
VHFANASQASVEWWLSINIKARCSDYDKDFLVVGSSCYSFLTREYIYKLNPKYIEDMEGLGFSLGGAHDFDGDGEVEYFKVGVFSEHGRNGRFLMIANDSSFKDILKVFHKYDGVSFSAVNSSGNVVSWFSCMKCEDKEEVLFSDGLYFLN